MARKLDHVLVIDLEATCWEGPPPEGQANEIIEIGLVPVELSTGRRLEKRSILVRPERSTVSAFCTQLTTLTQAQVETGLSLSDACKLLKKEYNSAERVFASWGDYDRKQFERQCRDTGIGYPFGPTHLNLKSLFALARGLQHEVGVPAACGMLGLPFGGTHHRGHDDAWNIAAVFLELLKRLRA